MRKRLETWPYHCFLPEMLGYQVSLQSFEALICYLFIMTTEANYMFCVKCCYFCIDFWILLVVWNLSWNGSQKCIGYKRELGAKYPLNKQMHKSISVEHKTDFFPKIEKNVKIYVYQKRVLIQNYLLTYLLLYLLCADEFPLLLEVDMALRQ